jgi:hypothetical protein
VTVNLLDPGAELSDLFSDEPWCGINLTLAPAGNLNSPAGELGAASILVTGTRLDGAPFVISSVATLPISLSAANVLEPLAYESVLLGFDVAVWLSGTDLEAIPLDAEGVARLDGAAEPGATTTFESRIPAGTGLYPDLDADRVLDADELLQPLARATALGTAP